ncbi:MAG TPA: sigma-70 family RNA polymerase sigma factor [Gemmatimonadaceae bacterium]|nr:sigma-70 family RNA polymerase sigma factor [Gemmatimonadaceae bacterium]
MADAPPQELATLLNASDPPTREAAWDAFVAVHSRLLLHTARSLNHDYDTAMDSYTYVLEALHEDGHRRLRAYSADGRGKFSTWLVVVARRLCLDYRRHKYGRSRDPSREGRESHAARRRLVDLVSDEIDVTNAVPTETDPALELQQRERSTILESALRALSPRDRLLLTLRFEDDLSAREIAQVTGMATPFHVYRRLNHVLDVLRATLRGRGLEPTE